MMTLPKIPNTPPLRDNQRRAIEDAARAFDQGFKTVIIQAPTGTGKTLISRFCAEMFGTTLVGVPTRSLQDQYAAELTPTGGVAVLKGKANYTCDLHGGPVPDAACQFENSMKQVKVCSAEGLCTYLNDRTKAQLSKIAVLSFAGQLSWSQFAPDYFGGRDLHIVDEAHKIEDTVRDHFSITLSETEIRKFLGKYAKNLPRMPEQGDTQAILQYLKDGAAIAAGRIAELMELYHCSSMNDLYAKAEESTTLGRSLMPVLKFKANVDGLFKGISEDSGAFVSYIEMRETKDKAKTKEPHIVSKPTRIQSYVKEHVLGTHTVLMSATLVGVDEWAKSLGIENYKFLDIESTFPAKNRPVYFTPIGNLNSSNLRSLLPKGASFLKKIMAHPKYHTEKGLIHTPSYLFTEWLEAELNEPRILFSRRGANGAALKEHTETKKPSALAGPNFTEGIDLKESLCRWIIIWKCRFGNPNDPLVMAMQKKDPNWQDRRIIGDFIQQIGRGVRSKEDWATTYVFDGNMLRILRKHQKLVPKYIWESFQNMS